MKKELIDVLISANDFAQELTNHNVLEKDLRGEDVITEQADNIKEVREIFINRGVNAEVLSGQ